MTKLIYTESDLALHSTWRHLKTGAIYLVLGIGICSTNGGDNGKRSVIYCRASEVRIDGKCAQYYYREVLEFLDGRFVPDQGGSESVLLTV